MSQQTQTVTSSRVKKSKPNTSLVDFGQLRKKIAKPSPFGRKLVDMYKQGR
ncbi:MULTISPECIES: hypothetical protein [Anoxybacillus]|uniref:hypothetical protein n=1 Tax=Anoxybacillus TaxID=150247 RepID=UPI00148DFD57|nr:MULTISPECIES: hypothetical protein [Anoxybacillus]MCQ5365841.1 hypothetical protein [Anoxybacillus gonensis]